MLCSAELQLFDLNNNATISFLEAIIRISNSYGVFHKYICLFLCVVGIAANLVHILVLTRPVMNKSGVNRLLSIIALCDIFIMISYTFFIIRFGFMVDLTSPPVGYELRWIVFLMIHVIVSIAFHTIALYLWVATAMIRYKTLKKLGSKWNRQDNAIPIFIVILSIILVLCVPTFLVHDVVKVGIGDGEFLYNVGLSELSTENTCFIFKLNLWLTGIFFKVIPCILLFTFTLALLWELELNRRRRKHLISGYSLASKKITAQSDRTTIMLVILLGVFLTTELPQGILAILNGLFPNDIHQFIYLSLGEILDLLSLINCTACFIIYPIMSSVYRQTLRNFFMSFRRVKSVSSTTITRCKLSSLYEPPSIKFCHENDVLL